MGQSTCGKRAQPRTWQRPGRITMRTSNPQEPERGPAVLTLADLLRGHLDGVTSIVEVAGPDLDLKLRLDVEHTADGGIPPRRATGLTGSIGKRSRRPAAGFGHPRGGPGGTRSRPAAPSGGLWAGRAGSPGRRPRPAAARFCPGPAALPADPRPAGRPELPDPAGRGAG